MGLSINIFSKAHLLASVKQTEITKEQALIQFNNVTQKLQRSFYILQAKLWNF